MHIVTAQQLILQAWQLKPFQQVSSTHIAMCQYFYIKWQSDSMVFVTKVLQKILIFVLEWAM